MFLTNAVNVASKPPVDRSIISVSGSIVAAGEAIYASKRIPKDMSASEAAQDFCYRVLPNLRDKAAKVPKWFARSSRKVPHSVQHIPRPKRS
jgi:hypothetical protein